MSLESGGEPAAELSEELFSSCKISNNNNNNMMTMSLIVPSEANNDGIELHSMPPMVIEPYSENESEIGYGLKNQIANLTPQNKPISEKTRAIRASSTIKRAMSLPRTTQQPTKHLTPLKQSNNTPSYREAVTPALRLQTRTKKPQKPNSLPQVQSRAWKPGGVVSSNAMSTSLTTTKHKVVNSNASSPMDRTAFRIRSSLLSVELKSSGTGNQSPYGTMPRRRKQKSIDDLQDNRSMETRSQSVSRDMRMTTSIGPGTRKQLQLSCSGTSSNNSSAWTTPTHPYPIHWPNYNCKQTESMSRKQLQQQQQQQQQQLGLNNKAQQRTRIFYEQSVQTSLTGHDLEKLFTGECNEFETSKSPACSDSASIDRETQCSDIRDNELERLKDELRTLNTSLQREREEKLIMQRELQLNTERVMGMLELARVSSINGSAGGWTPTSEDDASSCSVSGHDSLLMLESQIQMSGHELVERQQEIRQLRQFCRSLQAEMERSVAAQQYLLQEKAAIEEESNEMQDFLQHEKAAMVDALRELEVEFESCKVELNERNDEVKALREKCRYLVRSNEQRRQENLLLQTKYSIFKSKSKDQVAHEHTTISSAYNALSKLHLRLKSLVDELKLTYNITEQELELQLAQLENHAMETEAGASRINTDALSHYQSNMTAADLVVQNDKNDDEEALSPERHKSFIAAIIGAIRTAATPHKRSLQSSATDCRAVLDGTINYGNGNGNCIVSANNLINDGEMLDAETEPCLMMDNVLQDVEVPDTYSNNLVSTAANVDMELINVLDSTEIVLNDSVSFHNLSQAIVNRKNMEQHTNEANINIDEMHENCHSNVKALIEKLADVDTLVTRLLRLIQMDNDNCIQQLIVDKNKLQQHKEEMLDKIRELQQVNIKLQDDLMDATQELMLKNNERNGKKELQSHHSEIDLRDTENSTLKSKLDFEKMNEQPPEVANQTQTSKLPAEQSFKQNEIFECDVIEVMDLLSKLQAKTDADVTLKPLRMHDEEGNVQTNFKEELPSPNQLEDILNTFDTVDNLDDIDAEVQQTIMKLKENWSNLCLSNDDFVDSNANAN